MKRTSLSVLAPLIVGGLIAALLTCSPNRDMADKASEATSGDEVLEAKVIGIARDELLYDKLVGGPDKVDWFTPAEQAKHFTDDVGIKIGEKIPPIRARDQHNQQVDFNSLKGPKGAILLFVRSADW